MQDSLVAEEDLFSRLMMKHKQQHKLTTDLSYFRPLLLFLIQFNFMNMHIEDLFLMLTVINTYLFLITVTLLPMFR